MNKMVMLDLSKAIEPDEGRQWFSTEGYKVALEFLGVEATKGIQIEGIYKKAPLKEAPASRLSGSTGRVSAAIGHLHMCGWGWKVTAAWEGGSKTLDVKPLSLLLFKTPEIAVAYENEDPTVPELPILRCIYLKEPEGKGQRALFMSI